MTGILGRVVGAGQLVLGLVTVARPATVVHTATRGRGSTPDLRIVRVLGSRQLAQGAVTLLRPAPSVLLLGAVVDALHAASLVPIIAGSARYRRAAAASTALAAGAAAAEWAAAHSPNS